MIQIQIWADFECPYSYFQTIALCKLKDQYPDKIDVVWRAFELSPVDQNTKPSQTYIDNLESARKELIVSEENLKILTPQFLTYTWLAQECVCYANTQGLSLTLARKLFDAFFLEGLDITHEETVIQIASNIGINPQHLRAAIDDGTLSKHVMQDEQEFRTYGFQGLPAMLIGEKDFSPKSFMPISGYQTLEEVIRLLPSSALK